MPDPVARAVECMLEHMHRQDAEIAQLREALRQLQPGAGEIAVEELHCSLDAEAAETDVREGTSDRNS
jgi:serine O-acetyltransferase